MREEPADSSRDALETTRRLEAIVASAIDAIITINDQQRVILFNPAAEQMFGLPSAQALGEPISRFIPERFRVSHAAHIHRFATTGVSNRRMGALGAISGLRANGSEFPIEASISQAVVGGERLSTVILRDISERRAADEALQESRMRMERIVESAMDALITVDDQQRIVLFNPAAERMFGVPACEAIGSPIERFMPERFRSGHSEHIRRFKRTGDTNRRMGALGAISGLRANGQEFPIEASISQVDVGEARLATVILRDITERVASEEARNLLAREVDHRAKNALAVVQALVSLTRAATTEQFIEAVRGRVSALGRAHSLLAQNRWEGADLKQIIADETAAYGRPGQIRIHGGGVLLSADAVQPVSLLVHELATNAVKYGALSAEGGRVDVEIERQAGAHLELRWAETGGPTVQVPTTMGFGSTLVREVATRQLGGTLHIDWPAHGLQLSLQLPTAAFRAESGACRTGMGSEAGGAVPASRGVSVLVVEDDAVVALGLCQALTDLGWRVVGPAATRAEAMQLIADHATFDAAVLDVNLAGLSAYPIAERLEALGVPFLFCTGYQTVEGNLLRDSHPIVRKPVDIKVLARELQQLATSH